jgi:hypothetical protein
MLWLEELSRTGRSDSLVVAMSLPIVGGTANQINPIAVQ